MQENHKFLVAILTISFLLLVLCSTITHRVNAEEISTITVLPDAGTPLIPIPHIDQGDTVYVNDTIDISGVCSDVTQIAWYGKYSDAYSPGSDTPTLIVDLPQTSMGYYKFYLDPATFLAHPGMWYKYYGSNTADAYHYQRAGNLQAFNVVARFRNISKTTNANTTTTTQYESGEYAPVVILNPNYLPDVHVSDYLVAKGDSLDIKTDVDSKVWIFGRVDGIYNRNTTNNSTHYTIDEIESLEVGTYKVLIQQPGKNTVYEANISPTGKYLEPGLYGKKSVNIEGFSPMVLLERVEAMLKDSDDTYKIKTLEVQEPSVSVVSIDEITKTSATLLDIRGYTNVANQTNITFILDEDKQTPRTIRFATTYANAWRNSPGDMSMYQVYVPIALMDLTPGMHFITAKTALGGESTVEWYVYNMPEGQQKPNGTIKYISGRYGDKEFVPTPTPITIIETQIVPGPTRTIIVKVTPPQEMVDAAQKKATEEVALEWVFRIAGIIILCVVVIAGGWYAVRVYRRL